MISYTKKMLDLFKLLPAIAQSESTVLIEGESGTSKELVAHALHNLSSQKNGPFISINCGALPDTLLESELFGYVAGAFTAVGSAGGALIGSWLMTDRLNRKQVKLIIGVVLLGIAAKIIWNLVP